MRIEEAPISNYPLVYTFCTFRMVTLI